MTDRKILIHQFKDFIQIEDDVELSDNEDVENSDTSIVNHDLNEDNVEAMENDNFEVDCDLNDETNQRNNK